MSILKVTWAVLGAFVIGACVPKAPPPPSGQALYQGFCQSCHGDQGKGDGPLAGDLARKPADLTRISARNGGVFPTVKVMSVIDGYTRKNDHGSIMPEMGAVLADGPMVLVETGDGIETPVPAQLYALSEYLRGIQTR
jgi:mono/diheme cytochrome c family protein